MNSSVRPDSRLAGTPPQTGRVSYGSLLSFYLFLLLLSAGLGWAGLTSKPDLLIHDWWVQLDMEEPPDDVVIVGVDSRSLQEAGRWPWARDIQAKLLNRLTDAGARSVVLDILFTEPDRYSESNDFMLAEAISRNGSVVLPILTGEYSAGSLRPESLPIPEVTMGVAGLGHVFMPYDPDGIVRRVNLKSGFKAAHWSTLGLALAEVTGEAPESLPGKRRESRAPIFSWISDYQVLIPFYGEGGTFPHLSASQVIDGEFTREQFAGKHVFVGVTAVGLGDILPTPVSSNENPMSGVEMHATLFSALRDGRLISETDSNAGLLVTAGLLLLVLVFYTRLSPGYGFTAVLVLATVPILISLIAYREFQIWYAPLSSSLPLLLSFPLWSWNRLQFVSGFIQRQINEVDAEIAPVSSSESQSLVSYLDAVMHHLPVDGWQFNSDGKMYANGAACEFAMPETVVSTWQNRGRWFFRSYDTSDRLCLCLSITDIELADEITQMIDSLARIRDRARIGSQLDAVERLQVKAQQLSNRMEQLRRINTVSESIFHGSPAGLVVWNVAGEFVRMNELALSMLPQVLNQEPEFKTFLGKLGREPEREDAERVRALLIDRVPWQIEHDAIGAEMVMDFSVIGNRFADRLLVASIVDVSQMRESERARAEMVEYLSHDLRSPLISTIYMLSTQKEQLEGVDSSSLDRVEHNINRSLMMIDDLLNLSRADNLRQEELEPVLFDNVVNNAMDQLIPQAQNKSIRLLVEQDDEDEIWVNGNAILLERALVNVIGNALKYSPEGTEVRVQVFQDGKRMKCSVDDQGIGMSEEQIGSLFQRFKRSGDVEREYQGSGLGLALVSRVVTQHHGQVSATRLSVGTRITLELPTIELDD